MKIRIFAHSRSGHHAFMHWLAHQLNGSVLHNNNCMSGWNEQKLIPYKNRNVQYGKEPFAHTIYSVEYFDLNDYKKYDFSSWKEDYVDILFLRDFYNWLASSHKWEQNDNRLLRKWVNAVGNTQPPLIELWKQYANEFLNHKILNKNALFVNYNEWFESKEYRKTFSSKLGINCNDEGLNDVPVFGGGSSYSQLSIRTDAQNKLKTTERWMNHRNDEKYVKYIENNMDAVELNDKIFNLNLLSLNPLEIN